VISDYYFCCCALGRRIVSNIKNVLCHLLLIRLFFSLCKFADHKKWTLRAKKLKLNSKKEKATGDGSTNSSAYYLVEGFFSHAH